MLKKIIQKSKRQQQSVISPWETIDETDYQQDDLRQYYKKLGRCSYNQKDILKQYSKSTLQNNLNIKKCRILIKQVEKINSQDNQILRKVNQKILLRKRSNNSRLSDIQQSKKDKNENYNSVRNCNLNMQQLTIRNYLMESSESFKLNENALKSTFLKGYTIRKKQSSYILKQKLHEIRRSSKITHWNKQNDFIKLVRYSD